MRALKPTSMRFWLTANNSASARSMASLTSAGSSYPIPAIRPAAPMRLRRTALRSTIRAYCAAWTAVGVSFERLERYARPPIASSSSRRSSASATVTMSMGSRRSNRSRIAA